MRIRHDEVLNAVAALEPTTIAEIASTLRVDRRWLTMVLVREMEPAGLVSLRKGPDAVMRVMLAEAGLQRLAASPG
jgi:DNA-binding MarR family transcriptional regulator